MHLHILGICGTFMGGLAAIAVEAGHKVTGCDANVYPPMSTQLAALGIALTEGYGAEQLDTLLARLAPTQGPGQTDLAGPWRLQWDRTTLHLEIQPKAEPNP